MSMLNFNAADHSPSTANEPVPDGWYKVVIDESEMKATKTGGGQYLQIRFNIIEGQFANRKVFTRLNLINSNETAVSIAQSDLSAICHAVKVMQINDSVQLHNIPLQIKVVVKAADGQYGASNEVKGYDDISANNGVSVPAANSAGTVPSGQPATAQSPAAWNAPTAAQPWETATQPAPQNSPTAEPTAQAQAATATQPVAEQPASAPASAATTPPPWAQGSA